MLQHRTTYRNDVIPDSLLLLVLVVVGGDSGTLPILIDTSNVAEARSHAPSLARLFLSLFLSLLSLFLFLSPVLVCRNARVTIVHLDREYTLSRLPIRVSSVDVAKSHLRPTRDRKSSN